MLTADGKSGHMEVKDQAKETKGIHHHKNHSRTQSLAALPAEEISLYSKLVKKSA